jgi:predicted ATPase
MRKITRVKFYNHPVLGDSEIKLVDVNEFYNSEYISLIIGQNGTGKSKLLEAVSSFLINIVRSYNQIKFRWDLKYGIEIDICFDNEIYTFKYLNEFSFVNKSGKKINEKDLLPDNLIVNVNTFNDKYPFIESEDFYNYCGLRTVSNNIYVNVPVENCFLNLTSIIQNEKKIKVTNNIFSELNFQKKISVHYIIKNKKFLTNPKFLKIKNEYFKNLVLTEKHLSSFISILTESISNKRVENFKIKRFINNSSDVKETLDFLIHLEKIDKLNKLSFSWEEILSNVDEFQNKEFLDKIEIYKILREIGILQFENFQVYRDNYFDFNEASSGEFHFLNLFASVLSNIKDNSLVIIDEPEISLHPNWQNKLIYTLEPLFKAYPNSQFIIASHSHLMVSSLKKEKSSLITMKRKNQELKIENLRNINTYGWSAEQILFDVFGMLTDRNFYLSQKIQEIINEMSSVKPNDERILELKDDLKEYDIKGLHDNDPFKAIIENILK